MLLYRGYIWKSKAEEAKKVVKPWTELEDPGKEMFSLFLQEHLLFPFFLKVLVFSRFW